MAIELKPCPFCGGEARINHCDDPDNCDCGAFQVICDECGAETILDMVESCAIKAWNTRTEGERK